MNTKSKKKVLTKLTATGVIALSFLSCSPASAAQLKGAIGSYYLSNSNSVIQEIGSPISEEYPSSRNSVLQNFAKGKMYWSNYTGAHHLRNGEISKYYESNGGTSSTYGLPTTHVYSNGKPDNGWALQTYNKDTNKNYSLEYSDSYGVQPIYINGAIGGSWWSKVSVAAGEPSSPEMRTGEGRGYYQNFRNGQIIWSERTGAQFVRNGITKSFYDRAGGTSSKYGFPVSELYQTGIGSNGWALETYNETDNGRWRLSYTDSTGVVPIKLNSGIGSVWDRYKTSLGEPLFTEKPLRDSGAYQEFRNAKIYWNSNQQAFIVWRGPIMNKWAEAGWENGYWGYPTSGSWVQGDNSIRQNFENGYAVQSSNGNVKFYPNSIDSALDSASSDLGYAKTKILYTNYFGNPYKVYQNGVVVFTDSYGAVKMSIEVFNAWNEQLRWSTLRNEQGLPKSSYYKNGILYTVFENRTLYWNSSQNLVKSTEDLGDKGVLILGDSQVDDPYIGQNSWVIKAISKAGYSPRSYARAGTGFATESGKSWESPSYYQGVMENRFILPDNVKYIYIQGSANDTRVGNNSKVYWDGRSTVDYLKRMYPNAKIVVGSIVSSSDPDNAWRVNQSQHVFNIARDSRVYYLDETSWWTTKGTKSYLLDGAHLSYQGHLIMADKTTWDFVNAFARA